MDETPAVPEKIPWLLWLSIVVAIPLIYFATQSGPRAATPPSLPLEPSSVTTVSRENTEHELAALSAELAKNPDHTPVLLRMAQLSRDLGRPTDAIMHLRAALEIQPDDTEARLELGRVLYQSGDIPGAIAENTRLLNENPANVDALYNLGAIYGNMMDDARARAFWEQAIAIDPESASGKLAARGLTRLTPTPVRTGSE